MDAQQVTFWIQQGPFALLFVSLLVYVMRDSKAREKKYQETIDKLVDKLSIVDTIKGDVEELKNFFKGGKNK
ncbi:BhlA/UviB family holin-like peptide [Proteiniclasticum ruminis]|uniref:BhlA/UviB family holin-like peptide n=1 Tax=Proteiniclasticum ruminis TaxID=398199 RepID=UPI0028ADCC71|nr:BhlA/UviB family holin-like peptide [Proteiniclasticum ruminis]